MLLKFNYFDNNIVLYSLLYGLYIESNILFELIVEKLLFIRYNKKRIGGNVYGKEKN